ncbi:MAG: hypothetical protein Q8O67_11225 [Deltaproteobacteria bacterium]|nr:hypothetical protein [Deltaproteobacteria bacterium]
MVAMSKAGWSQLSSAAQRVIQRVSELGAMDRRSIVSLCLRGERKSAAGRRDLRLSSSSLQTRSAMNRIARMVAAKVLVYDRSFTLAGHRYYPVRVNPAHKAINVVAVSDIASDAGVAAAAVARDLHDTRGFIVGRDRDTFLAYAGGGRHSYRCQRCSAQTSFVESLVCAGASNACCCFEPFANDHALVADLGVRVKQDGSLSCALVWADDGRCVDEQWARLLPLFKLAQEPRVSVVVRPRDGSVYSTATGRFSLVHPRLERMLGIIEAAGGKATAGGAVAHRHVEELSGDTEHKARRP